MENISLKQGTPTDDELEELGQKIGEDWKKLGRRLDVKDEKLQEIDLAHNQLSEKGYNMLKHWRNKNGSDAKYQVLHDALKHPLVERCDLAEQFCYSHPDNGNLSFKIRCDSATSKNSQEQDSQEKRERVNRHMKQKVDEANGKFDLSSYQGLLAFHTYLVKERDLMYITFKTGCIEISVKCCTLEILELLWDDYRSGHLNAVAEQYLITKELKEELDMETITLTTTILEMDYLACKMSLMPKISGKHADSMVEMPKFNRYSYAVVNHSKGKLLAPQAEALQCLQVFFERYPAGRIGLISMPIGSGKNGVISCLPYFLGKLGLKQPHEEGAPPYGEPLHTFDKPVLVIAPDLRILKQLEGVLTVSSDAPGENFLLKRGIVPSIAQRDVLPNSLKIEETSLVHQPEYLESNEVIITNAQKFLKADWEYALPDDIFKLVIVDGAYHHPASTWHRIIQKFKNHAMVVFFTASPFIGDGQRELEDDEGEMVYRLSLEDARGARVIRRITWVPLHSEDTDLNSIFTLILERVKSIQQKKDQQHPLPDNIPHMAIAITKNIAFAEQVRDLWNKNCGSPNSAIAYHSDVPKKAKLAMMQVIKTNQVQLVVVVDMLREGFDHPPISIAAIMTKIVSPVKFAQFIGRAQRIVRVQEGPESDKICADVVTHSYFQQEKNYLAFENEALIPDV
ncbi:uncharacterized protein LOC144660840 [Oculina patagonica]